MDEFRELAKNMGLIIHEVVISGTIQRVPIENGKNGNKDGAYCLYPNSTGVIAGWVQNFRTGEYSTYGKVTQDIAKEIIQKKQKLEDDLHIQHDKIAKKAFYLIRHVFAKAITHQYLERKQIKAHGSLIDTYGNLILPLRNVYGEIRTFQRIEESGRKTFLKGSEQKGNFFLFGKIESTVIICEGFATGASIFESTNIPTISATNAGNLLPVTKKIRKVYGEKLKIIIAGDNDFTVDGNPGMRYAIEVTETFNAIAIFPQSLIHKEKAYNDFNDLMVEEGQNSVKRCFIA